VRLVMHAGVGFSLPLACVGALAVTFCKHQDIRHLFYQNLIQLELLGGGCDMASLLAANLVAWLDGPFG
jgi:hypothetical protein